MPHNRKCELIERQFVAKVHSVVDLSLNHVVVDLGTGHHQIKRKNRVAAGDFVELGAHIFVIVNKAASPASVSPPHHDLLDDQARLAELRCLQNVRVADVSLIVVRVPENCPNCVFNGRVWRNESICR